RERFPFSSAAAMLEGRACARAAATSSLPSRGPPAERGEQRVALQGVKLVLGEAARQPDRLAHLVQVVRAAVAPGQVRLEASALVGRQLALEVRGHQLDHLAAGELRAHALAPSMKCRSRADLTLERAPC